MCGNSLLDPIRFYTDEASIARGCRMDGEGHPELLQMAKEYLEDLGYGGERYLKVLDVTIEAYQDPLYDEVAIKFIDGNHMERKYERAKWFFSLR